MQENGNISYDISMNVKVYFILHDLRGAEISVPTSDFSRVYKDYDGKTVVERYWDDTNKFFPQDFVSESVEEVETLYRQACDREKEIYETYEITKKEQKG